MRYVVNTHSHPDHTGGNVHFTGTAVVAAHANVRKALTKPEGPLPRAPRLT